MVRYKGTKRGSGSRGLSIEVIRERLNAEQQSPAFVRYAVYRVTGAHCVEDYKAETFQSVGLCQECESKIKEFYESLGEIGRANFDAVFTIE